LGLAPKERKIMFDYKFDTPHTINLSVKNAYGDVTVRAIETSVTSLHLDGPMASEFSAVQDGDAITVHSPRLEHGAVVIGRGQRVDIVVDVPLSSAVRIKVGAGNITLSGVMGTMTAQSGAGTIAVDGISDSTRLETGMGNIKIGSIYAPTEVKIGSGSVELEEVAAPTKVRNGAGSLRVASVTGALDAKTGAGGANIRNISSGSFTFSGTIGKVRIGVPAGTPTWTDFHTTSGHVRSNLPPVGQPQPGPNYVELHVSTTMGSIELSAV
jgi:hypothetical protein